MCIRDSFLPKRTFRLRVDNNLSSGKYGWVPKKRALGPLLFSVHANDVPKLLGTSLDNTAVYGSFLQRQLCCSSNISEAAVKWKAAFNVSKSTAVVISRRIRLPDSLFAGDLLALISRCQVP